MGISSVSKDVGQRASLVCGDRNRQFSELYLKLKYVHSFGPTITLLGNYPKEVNKQVPTIYPYTSM